MTASKATPSGPGFLTRGAGGLLLVKETPPLRTHFTLAIALASILLALPACTVLRCDVAAMPVDVVKSPTPLERVAVFDKTTGPSPVPGIPIAQIRLVGMDGMDAWAVRNYLSREGAKLGAEFVSVVDSKTEVGGYFTQYAPGFGYTSPTGYEVVTAVACAPAPAYLGLLVDRGTLLVSDVTPGSPVATAGLHINDRVLAIGGVRLGGDVMKYFQQLAKVRQDVPVEFEIADGVGTQRTLTVVPAPRLPLPDDWHRFVPTKPEEMVAP
jgi:hypothetical protein